MRRSRLDVSVSVIDTGTQDSETQRGAIDNIELVREKALDWGVQRMSRGYGVTASVSLRIVRSVPYGPAIRLCHAEFRHYFLKATFYSVQLFKNVPKLWIFSSRIN